MWNCKFRKYHVKIEVNHLFCPPRYKGMRNREKLEVEDTFFFEYSIVFPEDGMNKVHFLLPLPRICPLKH